MFASIVCPCLICSQWLPTDHLGQTQMGLLKDLKPLTKICKDVSWIQSIDRNQNKKWFSFQYIYSQLINQFMRQLNCTFAMTEKEYNQTQINMYYITCKPLNLPINCRLKTMFLQRSRIFLSIINQIHRMSSCRQPACITVHSALTQLKITLSSCIAVLNQWSNEVVPLVGVVIQEQTAS